MNTIISCRQDIIEDKILTKIVEYLKDELNRNNPIENTVIVNSTRNYDAFNVPITDFPLLKIYRQRSQYLNNNKRISNLQLQYGLVLPDQEKLMPYLNWIDNQLNLALSQTTWRIDIIIDRNNKSCDYRTLLNELGIPVYSFLRFNFSIIEGNL